MNSLWRAIQYMNLLCLCLSSFLRLCTESRAVADGLFQETTRPKGIPLCCAFSIQTKKAGCGQHTLVKWAKIVSAGCLTDGKQAMERAETCMRRTEEQGFPPTVASVIIIKYDLKNHSSNHLIN